MAVERFELGSNSGVVELASNDGYLLQHVVERGIPALGVEPAANVAPALAAALDQELEQPPLGLLDPRRETAVTFERVEAERALALEQGLQLQPHQRAASRAALGVTRSDPP
jgi:hypothetical protein